MAEESSGSDWLTGFGTLLTGLAAMWAVWLAKDPVTNYFSQKQTQIQVVYINTCEAKKQTDELIEKSDDPQSFDKYLEELPAKLTLGSTTPMGLFIAPEFREPAKAAIGKAQTAEAKREILKNYWEKSLSKETKTNVDLKFNGEK